MSYSYAVGNSGEHLLPEAIQRTGERLRKLGRRFMEAVKYTPERRLRAIGGATLEASMATDDEPPIEEVTGISQQEALRMRGAQEANTPEQKEHRRQRQVQTGVHNHEANVTARREERKKKK